MSLDARTLKTIATLDVKAHKRFSAFAEAAQKVAQADADLSVT